jgi:hypothetical protein
MGPVMFCFDVSQTEGGYLPREIENPFFISGELPSKAYTNLVSSSHSGSLGFDKDLDRFHVTIVDLVYLESNSLVSYKKC